MTQTNYDKDGFNLLKSTKISGISVPLIEDQSQ